MRLLIPVFVGAFIVAVMAQKWKLRTGALWFFLTLAVEGLAWAFIVFTLAYGNANTEPEKPETQLALMIMATMAGAGLMAVIVASLPRRWPTQIYISPAYGEQAVLSPQDGVMTLEEKINYMLSDLAKKGIKEKMAAPPFHRLLWRLGLDIAPPLFAPFWSNLLITSILGAVIWTCGMILFLSVLVDQPLSSLITTAPVSGILFGLIMGIASATYCRWQNRKLNLPRWENYPNGLAMRP